MVRESRSQLPASRGATETICANVCMPARKSRLAKAASASLRKVATGLATWPDSVLIWVSSRTALSAKSDRWKGLSAAVAVAVKEKKATSAAAKPARTDASIKTSLNPENWGRAFPST
jgi:hypothetical protein